METIFSLSSLLTMPFWAMMIFAPGWQWTRRIIGSPYIVLPAAVAYVLLLIPAMGGISTPPAEIFSLQGVMDLFASEAGVTVGWIHFLAFDLFAGRWAFLDSQERGISHWLMAPILFFVLMLGPFGLALYLVTRAVSGDKKT